MPMGYKYEIVKEQDGYCFKLFPNNSRTQCIGTSVYYKDVNTCQKALDSFKKMLYQVKLSGDFSKYVDIKKEDGKYKFYFSDGKNNLLFYRDKWYEKKSSCNNGVKRIFENIDC